MLFADLFNKVWDAIQPAVLGVGPAVITTADDKKQVVVVRDGYQIKELPARTVSRPAHTVRSVDDLVELLDIHGRKVVAVVGDDGTVTVYVDTDQGPEFEFRVAVKAARGDVLGRWHGETMQHSELLERLTRYGGDFADQMLVKRLLAQLAQLDVKSSSGSSLSVGPNGEITNASATAGRSMSVQLPDFMDTVPVPLREDIDFPELPARLRVTAQLTDSKLYVRFVQVDQDAWNRVQVRNYAAVLRAKLLRRRAPGTVTVVCGSADLNTAYSHSPMLSPVRPVADGGAS